MGVQETTLPSNAKFGYLFCLIFGMTSAYFYYTGSTYWAYFFIFLSIVFLATSLILAEILLPLNKIWMSFGFLLGTVVNPIVLGVLFFGIFTPLGIIMRLFGRDELRLKFLKRESHWINRSNVIKSSDFKNQF